MLKPSIGHKIKVIKKGSLSSQLKRRYDNLDLSENFKSLPNLSLGPGGKDDYICIIGCRLKPGL